MDERMTIAIGVAAAAAAMALIVAVGFVVHLAKQKRRENLYESPPKRIG